MELFGTAGVRGRVPDEVDPELAVSGGRAAALAARDGDDGGPVGAPTFAVGRDARTTGDGLAAAVAAGLQSGGADVRRVGQVPTPALAFASRGRRGVMVTASHNPPTDNGLKLFVDGTEYDGAAERAVEDRLDATAAAWDGWGTAAREEGTLAAYREAVAEYVRGVGAPLDGLRVAVDAGNGTAGLATPAVVRALGGEVVALDATPDGQFPARDPKPTAEALSAFRAFVADGAFAFGVAHDGDGDRVVVVDGDGEVVHEDTVLAILAEAYVRAAREEAPPDGAPADGGVRDDAPVVVTTPNASGRIDERVAAAGGRVERAPLGALHEGVASVRAAGGRVAFAGEPWKHLHPGLGGWLDGTATAAVLARLVADRGLDALRAPVAERPYRKTDVACSDAAKIGAMIEVASRLPDRFPDASVDTEHGVRLAFDDGSWALVRPSGTEPVLRIYVESDRVTELLDAVTETVRAAVAAAADADRA